MVDQKPQRDPKRAGNYLTTVREEDGQLVADVCVAGETRTVGVQTWSGGRYITTDNLFLARVGHGARLWPTSLMLHPQGDGEHLTYHYSTTHLNRQARIIGWDEARYAQHYSQHNSARRAPSQRRAAQGV